MGDNVKLIAELQNQAFKIIQDKKRKLTEPKELEVAVCIYGFLRDWEDHRDSLNKNIIEKYDADLFVATPYQKFAPDGERVGTQELKKNYSNLEDYFRWEYDESRFRDETSNLPENNSWNQQPYRIFSFFFHLSKSVELCRNKIDKTGKNYDWIFVSRPDITFHGFWLNIAEEGKVNIRKGKAHHVPDHGIEFDDKFLLGGEEILCLEDLYKDNFKYCEDSEVGEEQVPAPNELICHHLIENGCDISRNSYVLANREGNNTGFYSGNVRGIWFRLKDVKKKIRHTLFS